MMDGSRLTKKAIQLKETVKMARTVKVMEQTVRMERAEIPVVQVVQVAVLAVVQMEMAMVLAAETTMGTMEGMATVMEMGVKWTKRTSRVC